MEENPKDMSRIGQEKYDLRMLLQFGRITKEEYLKRLEGLDK